MSLFVGLDIGASLAKAVVLDADGNVGATTALDSRAADRDPIAPLLAGLFGANVPVDLTIGLTGAGSSRLDLPPGAVRVNEVVALAQGASRAYPEARSVIEVGAQSSRWVELDGAAGPNGPEIRDFALNEKCAAGAGAFLEQQAGRLRISIDEFSKSAAAARLKVKVAGRCSVFAQSDMIHLQQKGTPTGEIAYGLCLALVRNFIATVLKGKDCPPPVVIAGGGALNAGLTRAFGEILGLGPAGLVVARDPLFLCAQGAALVASSGMAIGGAARARSSAGSCPSEPGDDARRHPPLGWLEPGRADEPRLSGDGDVEGYLGVDVGSVSTDLALIDAQGKVLAGSYVPTAGRPIQALREAYAALLRDFRGRLAVLGVGTTGSGRYLAGRIIDADVVHNEITCQMRSTLTYFPEADTVFEIGGQDSKFISLGSGRIRDFTMNKICAAGTGSFLEEQAALLGIDIKTDFSALAGRSTAPHDLGSRCTVFMETELVGATARGVPVPDIAAGLAFSVARNYLEKVVAPRPVGRNVVFQGGVASNAAVVKAFSLILGRPVSVHPYNRISGALGAALMARDVPADCRTMRDGADLEKVFSRDYDVSSFECRQCSNRCTVNRIAFDGKAAYFGDTCERYTSQDFAAQRPSPPRASSRGPEDRPDLLAERPSLWESALDPASDAAPEGPVVGLPRVSHMIEFLPFWTEFFKALGCRVVLSPASDMALFERGLKRLPAEVCLPAKVAFGHFLWLKESGVANVFFPSILSFGRDDDGPTYPCPYSELLPAMVRSALDLDFLVPRLDLKAGEKDVIRRLEEVARALGCRPNRVAAAFDRAKEAFGGFESRLRERSLAILDRAVDKEEIVLAILGRPYNIFDPFVNLNLARHLKKLGVTCLPLDGLPLEPGPSEDRDDLPVWRYNRKIIRAARWTLTRDTVFPIILTNFGCGPDAFGLKHMSRILADKPHLVLEFDEHQAEAGLVTRLEAFLDEVRAFRERGSRVAPHPRPTRAERRSAEFAEFREAHVFVPYFSDHAHAYSGALRAIGVDAELLGPPDETTRTLGEAFSSGKECHAFSILTGDLIKLVRSKPPAGSIYYFPGCESACLLQQYGAAMNLTLREMGETGLKVVSKDFDFTFRLLGLDGMRWLWRGVVAADLLIKEACRIRPYERESGLTDEVHRENLRDVEQGLADRDLTPALTRCVDRLRSIPARFERRPLVGVAGDIYTRINGFANNGLFHKLEAMGCEVWPAPFFIDEAEFAVGDSLALARRDLKLPELAAAALLNLRKNLERDRVRRTLGLDNARFVEPGYDETLRYAAPYLSRENNALVVLNVAKMVDYARRGAAGVINVICFNCMLGTVAGALAEAIRRDFDHIPLPTLVFSGSDSVSDRTRLEAFVHQVKRFAERRDAGKDAAAPSFS